MSQISMADFWMGRDKTHASECTPVIRQNATVTVNCVNQLLAAAAKDGVTPGVDEVTKTAVASGWRPAGINSRTANSGTTSSHITAEGCDLEDTFPARPLARWCLRNLDVLERLGLWMEDPRWTMTANKDPWVHLQIKPPKSGKRVYVPSSAAPLAPALPEQENP